MNDILAICIPTFNRADKLKINLEYHVPKLAKYGIPIYISDNGSSDNTYAIVKSFQKQYENIFYHRNEQNLGPDKNFELVLKLSSDCRYSWLLGDDDYVIFDHFDSLLDKLNQYNYQIAIVNTRNQVFDEYPEHYFDKNKLLRDLSWHMTFISALIYSRDAVIDSKFYNVYDAGFAHVYSVFQYLANKEEVSVLWNQETMITTLRLDGELPSWYSKMLEIFGENWINTIFSLPLEYSAESKIIATRTLWNKSRIVSLKGLFFLRGLGMLSLSEYRRYKLVLEVLIGTKHWLIWLICLIPKSIISPVMFVIYKHYVKNRINQSQSFVNANIDNG